VLAFHTALSLSGLRRKAGTTKILFHSNRQTTGVHSPPKMTMKVDAHVHIWDPVFPTHKDHPLPSSLVGSVTDLISRMDIAGIDKTLVVQPINYKFDHTCIKDAIAKHPTRLFGVALADTALHPVEACAELEDRVVNDDFKGIRINPTFTPDAAPPGQR